MFQFIHQLLQNLKIIVLTELARRGMSVYIQSIDKYFPLDSQTQAQLLCEAIEAGQLETVRTLVTKLHANVNATEAGTPLLLATSRFNSTPDDVTAAIVGILIQAGADFSVIDSYQNTLLNRTARANKHMTFAVILNAIESVIPENDNHVPKLRAYLNLAPDFSEATPIYSACQNQNSEFVDYLLAHGADPHVQGSGTNLNLVELAKKKPLGSNSYKHTIFSRFLKDRIGLSGSELTTLHDTLRSLMTAQFDLSRKNGKKIIFVLGEAHGHYHFYQVEKEIFKIARELGISTLYSETNRARYNPQSYSAIDKIAHERFNMTIMPIDNHPDKGTSRAGGCNTYLTERNAIMANEINIQHCDAVFFTGAYHLIGFLENINTRIDPEKFHIVPLSLLPLIDTAITPNSDNMQPNLEFALNRERVIQIDRHGISDPEPVIEQWNAGLLGRHLSSLRSYDKAGGGRPLLA